MGDVLTFAPRSKAAAAEELQPISEAEIRERLGAVLQNALDVADDIIAVLDRMDGCPDEEDGADAEPSLAAPENHHGSQVTWLRGNDQDREGEAPETVLPEVAIAPEPDSEPLPAAIVLPWRGRGNVITAAAVALLDLIEQVG